MNINKKAGSWIVLGLIIVFIIFWINTLFKSQTFYKKSFQGKTENSILFKKSDKVKNSNNENIESGVKLTGYADTDQLASSNSNDIYKSIIKKSQQIIKQTNPEIFKLYTDYIQVIEKLSKDLHTDITSTNKIILKYGRYLALYQKLLKNSYKFNNIEKYEQFLLKNIEEEGLSIDLEKLRYIANKYDFTKITLVQDELQKYILPDGNIITPDLKESFIDFMKANNYTDPMTALEDYITIINKEKLKTEGKCDSLSNPIDEAECKYLKSKE